MYIKIYRNIIFFIFLFLGLSFNGFVVFADSNLAVDLTHAPILLKKEFQAKTNVDWADANDQTREKFYTEWLEKKKQKLQEYQESVVYIPSSYEEEMDEEGRPAKITKEEKDVFKKYGKHLQNVNFSIKYLFERYQGYTWEYATFYQQKNFLLDYEAKKELERKEKLRAEKEKRLLARKKRLEKKRLERKEKLKARKKKQEQKRKEDAKEKKEEEFSGKVQSVKDKLKELKKRQKERERERNQ